MKSPPPAVAYVHRIESLEHLYRVIEQHRQNDRPFPDDVLMALRRIDGIDRLQTEKLQ